MHKPGASTSVCQVVGGDAVPVGDTLFMTGYGAARAQLGIPALDARARFGNAWGSQGRSHDQGIA
jgi:hypothetical protein